MYKFIDIHSLADKHISSRLNISQSPFTRSPQPQGFYLPSSVSPISIIMKSFLQIALSGLFAACNILAAPNNSQSNATGPANANLLQPGVLTSCTATRHVSAHESYDFVGQYLCQNLWNNLALKAIAVTGTSCNLHPDNLTYASFNTPWGMSSETEAALERTLCVTDGFWTTCSFDGPQPEYAITGYHQVKCNWTSVAF